MTDLLHDLAPVTAFPTVDQIHDFMEGLAGRHPDRATVREVGRSRNGDPIQLLSLTQEQSHGSVLVIGQPHPNEPIGMATIMVLCERLLANPAAFEATRADWHFVPCVDPDGTRLNEGWFAGPWTRRHYARHFYRPGGAAQVEWTFPFTTEDFSVNAPMPETIALMAAIDETRPTVLASLHNAEMGGAYYYMTPADEQLYAHLATLCTAHDIPLHLGELDTPLSAELAPAIFTVPTANDLHAMAVAAGADPATIVSGASSLEYASRHGETFGLVIELPYWRDHRAGDLTPSPDGATRRDVVLAGLDLQESTFEHIRSLYDAASPLPPSPLQEAVSAFLAVGENGQIEAERERALHGQEFDRPATVAEAFSAIDAAHMLRLRLGGMLLRAMPVDAPCRAAAEQLFDDWCTAEEADSQAEPIPIRSLVAAQAGAILAATDHALSRQSREIDDQDRAIRTLVGDP